MIPKVRTWKDPCFEIDIVYARQDYFGAKDLCDYGLYNIYLYNWESPSGHTGIDHVYVSCYKEFLMLLKHWNRLDWKYSELNKGEQNDLRKSQ